jgi:hypothetical protein
VRAGDRSVSDGVNDAAEVTAAIAGLSPAVMAFFARASNGNPAKIDGCGSAHICGDVYGHLIALPATSPDPDQRPPLLRWASLSGVIEKGGNVRTQGMGVRQRITRVLAASALLFMYAFGMVATTGAFVAAGVSPAFAQRGRGRGRGGGWAEVEVTVSVQRSASASARPSSAARSRRAPPSSSGAMPSATACSAIARTIPTARPFSAMTACVVPARRERTASTSSGPRPKRRGFSANSTC